MCQNILYYDIYLLFVKASRCMSSKKQIIIDPTTLSGGQSSNAHKTTMKQRKTKPVVMLRPNTVKKNLLEKIKDFKRRNEETPLQEQVVQSSHSQMSNNELANQFKISSNYLEQLINKKKDARKPTKPKTPKQQPIMQPMQPMQQMQPIMQQMQPMQPMQPIMQPMQPIMQPMQPIMQPMQPIMQPMQPMQSVEVSLANEPIQSNFSEAYVCCTHCA
jgi:DNA primase